MVGPLYRIAATILFALALLLVLVRLGDGLPDDSPYAIERVVLFPAFAFIAGTLWLWQRARFA